MTANRWLLLIVAAGAVLRFVPVWFGLPYLEARPDESAAIGIAVGMLSGDLHPRFFHWPSLTFYLFAAVFWLAGLLREGPFTLPEYVLMGRVVVASAGTATIVLLWWMARRVAGETTARIAAALLAVAMLHVRDSHFAMTDVLMTLLVTAALALLLRALEEIGKPWSPWWFATPGLAGGLATSTKYSAAAIAAAMGAAQVGLFVRDPRLSAVLPSVAFGALFLVGFVLGTPYAVLDFKWFKTDVLFDVTHLAGGHGIDLGPGWTYHLRRSLPLGLGPTVFAAAIVGIVPLVRNHRREALVLGTFALASYTALGSGRTVFFRYIMPLVPLGCFTAALGVRACAEWLAGPGRLSRVARLARPVAGRRGAYTALLTLTIGPGLVNAVWFNALLARTDSRVLAGDWLKARLQPQHTLYDAGGNFTSLDLGDVPVHEWRFDESTSSFGHAEGLTPDWLVLYQSPLHTYTRIPWQLRMLAEAHYRRVHTIRASATARRLGVYYDLQDAFFMPFWGFWTVTRPGPTIHIYLRRDLPLSALKAPSFAAR